MLKMFSIFFTSMATTASSASVSTAASSVSTPASAT